MWRLLFRLFSEGTFGPSKDRWRLKWERRKGSDSRSSRVLLEPSKFLLVIQFSYSCSTYSDDFFFLSFSKPFIIITRPPCKEEVRSTKRNTTFKDRERCGSVQWGISFSSLKQSNYPKFYFYPLTLHSTHSSCKE